MSNFLEAIDKYKFGLIAALAAYVVIFMYLQMSSYEAVIHYEPFHDGSFVEIPDEEIELQPENILTPAGYTDEVRNISRDQNDERESSYENYSPNKSVADVEEEYRRLEQQMYDEAGGAKTREQIQKEMEARKEAALEQAKINENNSNNNPPSNTGDKKYAGSVMADWSLAGRSPHQNNEWYIRKPGYMCGHGSSGSVTIQIKVNQNGNVTSANVTQSAGANQCMIDNALKYAKLSRFNYSGSAPNIQSGKITYRFISQ